MHEFCMHQVAVRALATSGLHLPSTGGLTTLVDGLAEHLPDMHSSPRRLYSPSSGRFGSPEIVWCSAIIRSLLARLRRWQPVTSACGLFARPDVSTLPPSTCGVIACRSVRCVYSTSLVSMYLRVLVSPMRG
jgi:hypothetical protein